MGFHNYNPYVLGVIVIAFFVVLVIIPLVYIIFKREKTTASGKVVTVKDPFLGEISTKEEKNDEPDYAEEFASRMKELLDALTSVGFSEGQALFLMRTTIEKLDEYDYDSNEEFANDLWEVFTKLKEKDLSDDQALELIPLYWEN